MRIGQVIRFRNDIDFSETLYILNNIFKNIYIYVVNLSYFVMANQYCD